MCGLFLLNKYPILGILIKQIYQDFLAYFFTYQTEE